MLDNNRYIGLNSAIASQFLLHRLNRIRVYLKPVYERQVVTVRAAYPPSPTSSRLTDLVEMPQAATRLLAGCTYAAYGGESGSSVFASLVRRDYQHASKFVIV